MQVRAIAPSGSCPSASCCALPLQPRKEEGTLRLCIPPRPSPWFLGGESSLPLRQPVLLRPPRIRLPTTQLFPCLTGTPDRTPPSISRTKGKGRGSNPPDPTSKVSATLRFPPDPTSDPPSRQIFRGKPGRLAPTFATEMASGSGINGGITASDGLETWSGGGRRNDVPNGMDVDQQQKFTVRKKREKQRGKRARKGRILDASEMLTVGRNACRNPASASLPADPRTSISWMHTRGRR